MASTAKKQPIKNESAIGTAAANDNVEVKNASGSQGAKVINFKGNKIELDIDNPTNLVSTSKAANDNVQADKTQDTTTHPKPEKEQNEIQRQDTNPEQDLSQTEQPNLQPPNIQESKLQNNSADQNNELQNPNKETTPEPPPNEKPVSKPERPIQTSAPQNSSTENQPSGDQTKTNKNIASAPAINGQPPTPNNTPATPNQPTNEQPDTPQNTTTPPTVNKEALEQTGPHTSTNRTPNTIPTGEQKGVANAMSQPRGIAGLGAAGLGAKMGEGTANKIKDGVTDNKEQTKNITAGIANKLQSDRNIKRNLKKERKKLKTKLDSLERTVDGMKTNPAMLILRTISPSLYSQLTSLTIGKNLIKLQLNLVTLKTIKRMLRSMAAFVDYAESLFNVNKVGLATTEVIIGFFIIALSVFISIPLFIFKFGTNTGKLSKAITVIIKDIIDPMVEKIEQLIEPLKKKTELRKRIQNINVLLAGTKDERQQDLKQKNQQATKQRTETRDENEWKGYKRAPKIAK